MNDFIRGLAEIFTLLHSWVKEINRQYYDETLKALWQGPHNHGGYFCSALILKRGLEKS